ncbi:Multidrug efflux pump subunit AcrB [Desulfotomaculum arcticum]|uniref:Multidrug efflux pump subunit AcrB n=1 Tax=Desulfotruncus arcticus DSM 17038 TaxID=1121424 RepID=A0A1I2PE45_9FIRM|nr:efflux RND transporter permease subunit [Desulfotruncus arcticus]SFG11721.1 Multidrug efflux pump subunit AcrB [Desulfotomaculum arcticum] [Desulfotruncus arcticus DSM 17038]
MIEYIIKKRRITILFFVMVVAVGFLSLLQLPRQEDPDITIDFAMVTTTFPGASPEKVEQTVTKKIEQKIKELQGVETITSTSGFGYSSIQIYSRDGVEPQKLWDELRKKVKDAEADLPDGADKPVINDDLFRNSFYTVNITADTREHLYSLRDTLKIWRDQLRTLPGVADVTVGGLPEQEVRVDVDPQKLQSYGIPWTQVMAAVKSENERVPIGDLSIKGHIHQLKLPDTYKVDDLNRVIVSRTREGFPVYLKDVGRAYLSEGDEEVFVYHGGKPAAVLGIVVDKGIDIPSQQAHVDNMLEALKKTLPPWASVEPVYAQSESAKTLYDSLKKEMIIAIVAVLFVCTLGLNLITSVIIAFAIPISMAVGLIFLPPLGITLNTMSIFALIIVLGILVDDAVVVNDNIERHLFALKEPPFAAAVNGTREVSISILTATMATVCSFGPLYFLPGGTGEFIRPLPVVVALTMLASMVMSLTVVPIFRQWYEERRRGKSAGKEKPAGLLGRQLNSLAGWYGNKLMPVLLERPLKTCLTGVLIGTLAYGLVAFTPVDLFPSEDAEALPIYVRLPVGTDIEETHRVVKELRDWLGQQPEVKTVVACAGGKADLFFGGGTSIDNLSPHEGELVVKLDRQQTKPEDVAGRWQEELEGMYPGVAVNPIMLEAGPPVGDPISIHIYGDDIGMLRALAEQLKEGIAKVPGAYDIKDDFGADRHTLEFQVNKDMMDQKMVGATDLSRTLRLVGEGLKVGEFDSGKDLIDINLYSGKSGDDPMLVFQSLTVPSAGGDQVPLASIAAINPSFSIQAIPHRNLSRVVTITGNVRERTATEAMNDIMPILQSLDLPAGYRWDIGGEMSEQTDIFIDMGKLSIIVFFLILILMAMQFNSLSMPPLIMSTVYLAVAGSLIGLFITRTPLGFMSMLGVISLAGVVVRNGIVLIDFIEKARAAGMELKEAVIRAGEARLRPIILTTATATAGLLPMTLSGDPFFFPMGMTIISGLVFSTLLTLIVLPSAYTVLAGYREQRKARKALKEAAIYGQAPETGI